MSQHPASNDLQVAISEFIGAVEVLLHYDWDYTMMMIQGDEPSFLEPGLTAEEENEDWGSRGAFLEKYRALVAAMKAAGIQSSFPFPIEQLLPNRPDAPKVWSSGT